MHIADQSMDLVAGIAEGLLGGIDVVGRRFRLLRRLLGITCHADCRGAHLVHGAYYALQLQILLVQTVAHGVGGMFHLPRLLVDLLTDPLAHLHHAPQLAEEGIELGPQIDQLLMGVDLHLLGQVPLIAGEVAHMAADKRKWRCDGLDKPDQQPQHQQGNPAHGDDLLPLGIHQQGAQFIADGVRLAQRQRLGHLDHQPPLGIGCLNPNGLMKNKVTVAADRPTVWQGQAHLLERTTQLVGIAVATHDKPHLADQSHIRLVVIEALAKVFSQLLEDGQVHIHPGQPDKLAVTQHGYRQTGHQHLVARADFVEVGLHQAGLAGIAATEIPLAVANAKLVEGGIKLGLAGSSVHRLLGDGSSLILGEIDLQTPLACHRVTGPAQPVAILAIIPIWFKLGINGADPARLLQAAAEQRLHLGSRQPQFRFGHTGFNLGGHGQGDLIGVLHQRGNLDGIALCLILQAAGDLLFQCIAGLGHHHVAKGAERGRLQQGHGQPGQQKQPHGKAQQLELEGTLLHATTPYGRITTNYLSIFAHLRFTRFVDGFVAGFWL